MGGVSHQRRIAAAHPCETVALVPHSATPVNGTSIQAFAATHLRNAMARAVHKVHLPPGEPNAEGPSGDRQDPAGHQAEASSMTAPRP